MAAKKKKAVKKPAKARASPSATGSPGTGAAMMMGFSAAMAALSFAAPWYADNSASLSGYQLFHNPATLPHKLASDMSDIGGRMFLTAYLVMAVAGAAVGFAWPALLKRYPRTVRDGTMVYVAGAAGLTMALMLTFLEMKMVTLVEFGGHAAWAWLGIAATAGLVAVSSLDRREGKVGGALPSRDWAVWLSALAVTAAFHYVVVCYKIIIRAPQFLIAHIGNLNLR